MSSTTEKNALDANLVNAIIESTQSILSTMANCTATVQQIKPQPDYAPTGDISAVIGIMGEGGEGMIALSFPLSLASIVVSKLLGVSPEQVSSEDRCDGIGELVNMISGNTKTALSKQSGSTYTLSLPSIIQGSGHEIYTRPKKCPYLLVIFEAEQQQFSIQVSFKFN
ncbi:chemotaxis protein CheX [Vampirovibrio sp.]|uniref:chemotaxis protein CheX n=1 Tax=Vampirovibrio sp. TaxID=2717857 RepID=UPI003593FCE6